jgi:hypothetical protein
VIGTDAKTIMPGKDPGGRWSRRSPLGVRWRSDGREGAPLLRRRAHHGHDHRVVFLNVGAARAPRPETDARKVRRAVFWQTAAVLAIVVSIQRRGR